MVGNRLEACKRLPYDLVSVQGHDPGAGTRGRGAAAAARRGRALHARVSAGGVLVSLKGGKPWHLPIQK